MERMTSRSPLGELYDAVARVNGWSFRDVAARTHGGLSKSRIEQLVNAQPLEAISASNILMLAVGLGIAPERVALAAVQSMGFRVSGDSLTPAEAISRDESLSDDTRNALLAVLRGAQNRRGLAG